MLLTLIYQGGIVLLLCFCIGCASHRGVHEFIRNSDKVPVKCFEPPPDVIAKGGSVNADIAVKDIGQVLKGQVDASVGYEKIRTISPTVAEFEVIEFRICTQYGNDGLTAKEYSKFTGEILPDLKKPDTSDRTSQTTGTSKTQSMENSSGSIQIQNGENIHINEN